MPGSNATIIQQNYKNLTSEQQPGLLSFVYYVFYRKKSILISFLELESYDCLSSLLHSVDISKGIDR
jgi:hypothetical protein